MISLRDDLLRLQAGLLPEATPPPPPPSVAAPVSLPPPPSLVSRGVAVLAVVGVLASVLLGYALYLRGDEPVAQPKAEEIEPAPPSRQDEAVGQDDAPVAEEEDGRSVMVIVIPQDARISRGKEDLGTMPVTVHVPPGEKVHLGIRRKGFISRRLTLDGSRSKVVVGLVPKGRGGTLKSAAAAEAEAAADEAALEALAEDDVASPTPPEEAPAAPAAQAPAPPPPVVSATVEPSGPKEPAAPPAVGKVEVSPTPPADEPSSQAAPSPEP